MGLLNAVRSPWKPMTYPCSYSSSSEYTTEIFFFFPVMKPQLRSSRTPMIPSVTLFLAGPVASHLICHPNSFASVAALSMETPSTASAGVPSPSV